MGLDRLAMKRAFSARAAVRKRCTESRLLLVSLVPRVTLVTGLTSFAPGAYVIDMGETSQAVANSLRPYGILYDLVENQHIPVDWAINPNKSFFRVDFTAGCKSYPGSRLSSNRPSPPPQ